MATENHTRTIIRMAGLELETTGRPADMLAFADTLLGAASRALFQETTEGVTFEDADRYALSELIQGARDAVRGAAAQA